MCKVTPCSDQNRPTQGGREPVVRLTFRSRRFTLRLLVVNTILTVKRLSIGVLVVEVLCRKGLAAREGSARAVPCHLFPNTLSHVTKVLPVAGARLVIAELLAG